VTRAEAIELGDDIRLRRDVAAGCVAGLDQALLDGVFGPHQHELLAAGPRARLRQYTAMLRAHELTMVEPMDRAAIEAALAEAATAQAEAEGIATLLLCGAPDGTTH
jgi:hypothetical protein